MNKILIIDGTNQFIRFYSVIPSMDSEGRNNGGVIGFLQSLSIWIRMHQPNKVIVTFDGAGGSVKRRNILKDYKEGKKPIRLNRSDLNTPDSDDNKVYQRLRLAEYLQDLPVYQVVIPQVEADDVIAYLTKMFPDDEKIILSGDRDFYQLINDKVSLYNPKDKCFISDDMVYQKFGVHICNFVLARAFIGDKSDNLKGVKGIGFKTLIKLFPFISQPEKTSLDQMFAYCEQNGDKYKRFLENKEIVINNHGVMQLENPIIGLDSIHNIEKCLDKEIKFNATSFRMKMYEDNLTTFNDGFFQPFRVMSIK